MEKLPNRYSTLMPTKTCETLNYQLRAVSNASDISTLSVDSNVSDFLEKKIILRKSSLEYINTYWSGLYDALNARKLQGTEYYQEMQHIDKKQKPILEELEILEQQSRMLSQDIIEQYHDSAEEESQKRRKTDAEPSLEFMERAYSSTIVGRVMAACKQGPGNFNQSKFRKEVLRFYNANSDPSHTRRVWCHLTGWATSKNVKAAHLVPRSLRGDELQYLFGDGRVILKDPKNGKFVLSCNAVILQF